MNVFRASYEHLWRAPLTFGLGDYVLQLPIQDPRVLIEPLKQLRQAQHEIGAPRVASPAFGADLAGH